MKLPMRIRLALASCAVFMVVIAGLELIAYQGVSQAIHSIVDHELDTRLAGIDDHLTRHIARIPWPQLRDSLMAHPAFQPDLLLIQVENGETLLAGPGLRGLPASLRPLTPQTVGMASRTLRVLSASRRYNGRGYRLVLATDLFFSAKILGRVWILMVGSLPLVLLISGGAGYWISGRALAPVSNMIAAARAIDSTRLSERIAVPETGDEIEQLAGTMNAMLARIEESFRHVRQFIADASHELRTPLAIIRANAEVALLEEDASPASSREALQRILREAERDSALLEDMLHLARLDAATLLDQPRRCLVDLQNSIDLACADIQPLAESRGLHLRVIPSRAPVAIEGDAEQLDRLWLILLENACKYTPPGGVISAGAARTPDGRPCVFVEDTGIGIAPEHLNRVFERYYCVDKARNRRHGGSGLGLAIARQIATAHGAVAAVESAPGRGSRFSVTFARAVPATAPVPETSAIFR